MATILPGHVLEYDDSHAAQISHLDETGTFIAHIDIHGYTPGVDFVNVYCMTQFGASVYIAAQDFDPTPPTSVIQEYGADGAWIRDVVNGIDGTDPAQNPGSFPQSSLVIHAIWLDSLGNIYGSVDGSTEYVWVWTNAGTFVRAVHVNAHGVPSTVGGAITFDPSNDNEMDYQLATNVIYRYDLTTDTVTTVTPPGGGFFPRSDVSKTGTFFAPTSTTGGTARFRVYASGFGSFTDYSFSTPVGVPNAVVGRAGDDEDALWVSGYNNDPFPAWSLFQARLSTGAILQGPVAMTSGPSAGLAIFEHMVYRSISARTHIFGFVTGHG